MATDFDAVEKKVRKYARRNRYAPTPQDEEEQFMGKHPPIQASDDLMQPGNDITAVWQKQIATFVKLPPCVLYDPELKSSAKLVFSVILHHCLGNYQTWVSQTVISKGLKLSKKTIQRALKQLQENDLINIQRRYNDTSIISLIDLRMRYGTWLNKSLLKNEDLDAYQVAMKE